MLHLATCSMLLPWAEMAEGLKKAVVDIMPYMTLWGRHDAYRCHRSP